MDTKHACRQTHTDIKKFLIKEKQKNPTGTIILYFCHNKNKQNKQKSSVEPSLWTEAIRNKTSCSAQLQDPHILKDVYGADIGLKRTCQSSACHCWTICRMWLKGRGSLWWGRWELWCRVSKDFHWISGWNHGVSPQRGWCWYWCHSKVWMPLSKMI